MKKIKKIENEKLLSPAQILDICKTKIVDVLVPSWDACVRCSVPKASIIYDMRVKAKDNEVFQKKLFQACLLDFTPEQLTELEEANGLKYLELYSAVISNTDLFTQSLSKQNIKN